MTVGEIATAIANFEEIFVAAGQLFETRQPCECAGGWVGDAQADYRACDRCAGSAAPGWVPRCNGPSAEEPRSSMVVGMCVKCGGARVPIPMRGEIRPGTRRAIIRAFVRLGLAVLAVAWMAQVLS